jgi:hypothetical protein
LFFFPVSLGVDVILGIIKVGDWIYLFLGGLCLYYFSLCWYSFLPCSFPAMEPYGGDFVDVVFLFMIFILK